MRGDSVGEVEGAPPPPWRAPAHAPTAASVPPPPMPAAARPAALPADALAAVVARGEEADQQQRRAETSELSGEWFRAHRPASGEPMPPEEGGPDVLGALGRVRWECAALATCAVGPQVLGLLAVLIGGVMISRSRFWEIGDKVRALLGVPLAWFGLAVFWAWLRATELQQADASRARLAIAGHSLAHSWYLGPTLIGLGMTLVLGHRLVRDARWS